MTRPATEPTNPPDVHEGRVEAEAERVVGRLVRLHNLMVFVVFAVGLASIAVIQVRRTGLEAGSLRMVLVVLRVVLPVAALLITARYTHVGVRRLSAGAAVEAVGRASIARLFERAKTVSIVLLAGCGLFADVCLMFGNRMIDLVLAALAFGLLLATRPSLRGFAAVAALIETQEGGMD